MFWIAFVLFVAIIGVTGALKLPSRAILPVVCVTLGFKENGRWRLGMGSRVMTMFWIALVLFVAIIGGRLR